MNICDYYFYFSSVLDLWEPFCSKTLEK